jgi:hypothetical protein
LHNVATGNFETLLVNQAFNVGVLLQHCLRKIPWGPTMSGNDLELDPSFYLCPIFQGDNNIGPMSVVCFVIIASTFSHLSRIGAPLVGMVI